MMKKKSNHIIPNMNHAKSQGNGAGYQSLYAEETAQEPLSELEKQNNKKTKKRQ
ncbi:small acid-soluble spore protein O [Alkalihalobacillus sp. 1P02AB]|uniref:small acid-soluble spore protein O n=1 Tax=Alkalihalobacillus sp. 1P02AB TaxID=3132260 RepID=UPI0039A43E1D